MHRNCESPPDNRAQSSRFKQTTAAIENGLARIGGGIKKTWRQREGWREQEGRVGGLSRYVWTGADAPRAVDGGRDKAEKGGEGRGIECGGEGIEAG